MKKRHSIICASYLLLIQNGEVLLLRRFNTGYEDGNYSVPAGHVDQGESVATALVREVKEEISIKLQKEDLKLIHVMHRKGTDANDERLDFFFVCSKWEGEVENLEPHKCNDLRWSKISTLPENTIPYVKKAIQHSVDEVLYSEKGWSE